MKFTKFNWVGCVVALVLGMGVAHGATDIWVSQAAGLDAPETTGSQEDPFKTIWFAMALSASQGKSDPWTLHLKAGSYDTDPAKPADDRERFPITLRSGMTIIGEDGAANCVISGAYVSSATTALLYGDDIRFTLDNITLTDMNRTGGSGYGGAAQLYDCFGTIQNCVIQNCHGNHESTGAGIWITVPSGNQLQVIGNTMQNNLGDALYVASTAKVHCEGNTFSGNTYSGLVVHGDMTGDIYNNVFSENSMYGFIVEGNLYGNIETNTITQNSQGGYVTSSLTGDIFDNLVENNILTGGGFPGLHIQSTMNGQLYGNIFSGNTGSSSCGFAANTLNGDMTDNIFSQNRSVLSGAGAGITTMNGNCIRNVFLGNENTSTLYDGGAFSVSGPFTGIISQNIFVNNTSGRYGGALLIGTLSGDISKNTFISNSGTHGGSIFIYNFSGDIYENLIANNTATSHAAAIGLWNDSEGDAQLFNNLFLDNTLGGSSSLGATVRSYKDIQFWHNTVSAAGVDTEIGGLWLGSGAESSFIQNNIFTSFDTIIGVDGALNPTITHNNLHDATDILYRASQPLGNNLFNIELGTANMNDNHDDVPGFAGMGVESFSWTLGAYDSDTNMTTFTAASKSWEPNQWLGTVANLADGYSRSGIIVGNAATTFKLRGNWTVLDLAATGSGTIDDFRLAEGSANIETGTELSVVIDRDLEGQTRPNGEKPDIGADEYPVESIPPDAAFFGDPLTGDAPLEVVFTDESTGGSGSLAAWAWNFGDGETSNDRHPGHTYALPGSYTVSLTVTAEGGVDTDTITKSGYITVTGPPPETDFSAEPVSGTDPLTVHFTDLSTCAVGAVTAWSWDFNNDGTEDSTEQHPQYTYSNVSGAFTVALTATSEYGASDKETKSSYISVTPTGPTASFSANPVSGEVPLEVQFTDTSNPGSGPITAWAWDFGDGNTSTAQNPLYTYTTEGTYSVSLTVTTAHGTDTASSTNLVEVEPASPTADFTAEPTTGGAPLTVQFTDVSDPGSGTITAWSWDFDGDGSADSTVQNPSWEYTVWGTYSVSLQVTSEYGTDEVLKEAFITAEDQTDPVAVCRNIALELDASGTAVISAEQVDGGSSDNSGEVSLQLSRDTFSCANLGANIVKLTVEDGSGNQSSCDVTVMITDPHNYCEDAGDATTPEGFTVTSGVDHILLRWNGILEENLSGYRIYRREGETGNFSLLKTVEKTVTQYKDTAVTIGQLYSYQVTAVVGSTESSPTAVISAIAGELVLSIDDVELGSDACGAFGLNVGSVFGVEIRSLDITFTYDPTLIDADSVSVNRTAITQDMPIDVDTTEDGEVTISMSSLTPLSLTGEGRLFQVDICTLPGATENECGDLNFIAAEFITASETALLTNISNNGSICISEACGVQGDVNHDSNILKADAELVLDIAVRKVQAEECHWKSGNLNGDERLDCADAVIIMRMANSRETVPGDADETLDDLWEAADPVVEIGTPYAMDAYPGGTVEVPVTVVNGRGMAGLDMSVIFPPATAGITLETYTAGTMVEDFANSAFQGERYLRAGFASDTPISAAKADEPEVLLLQFKVADSVAIGTQFPIEVAGAKLSGTFGENFDWYTDVMLLGGTITVKDPDSEGEGEGEPTEGEGEPTEGEGEPTEGEGEPTEGEGEPTEGEGEPTEGEGEPTEGEGETNTQAIAQILFDRFYTADTDGNGTLSYEEAIAFLPSLTRPQFNTLDVDGNGGLTEEELESQLYQGCGCGCYKSISPMDNMKELFGDWLLVGLSLLVLLSFTSVTKK